jgi:hypothetical protein
MTIIDFQATERVRFGLIEKIRDRREREDPETDYTYAHYYNPEWGIDELTALAEAKPA